MNTFSLLEVELPEPSCCHLYLSPISHPLQFCVSDSGACVKSVRVLWRSPLCREPARGCIPSHLCIFTTQPCWFQKACPLSRRSTLPLSSPSPHLQVVLCVCSVLRAFSWQWCRGRMLSLADFPAALHGFCTMQASDQRLTLIPRLNSYQCLPIGWVKKLNPFLNFIFLLSSEVFMCTLGICIIPAALSCLFLH